MSMRIDRWVPQEGCNACLETMKETKWIKCVDAKGDHDFTTGKVYEVIFDSVIADNMSYYRYPVFSAKGEWEGHSQLLNAVFVYVDGPEVK